MKEMAMTSRKLTRADEVRRRRSQASKTRRAAASQSANVIRPLISRLRNKLDQFPGGEAWIVNIRGSGYSFEGEFEPVIQPVEKK